jgi:two-component system sensor histidine kinase/response regulator
MRYAVGGKGVLSGRGSEPTLEAQSDELVWRSRELPSANRALQERLASLEAENEGLRAFAHTVAHDLKGPAGNLAGYAALLRRAQARLSEGELQKCLDMMYREALKLSDIVDELLLLAELCQEKVQICQLDMGAVVGRALRRLAYRIDSCGAKVVLPDTWPDAAGYGPWIEEVWVNYVDNAIRYGGEPPCVELGAERVDGVSCFWVRDNGRGLTSEQQERLFVPFTRLEQAHTGGHGLGLSIVRQIVEKLGGTVGIQSDGVPGQGSVFRFTLPGTGYDPVAEEGIEWSKHSRT